MVREILTGVALCAAGSGLASPAGAEPGPMYSDDPGRYDNDVPGMDDDAHRSGRCMNLDRFTFGRGPGGEPLQCRWIPNQWPPVDTGFWQSTYQLYGVQDVGAPCPDPQAAAQAPDGRPLLCLGPQGWQAGFLTGVGFTPV